MKIGIDVESGEHSYIELVQGALNSIESCPGITIYLLGNTNQIKRSFPEIDKNPNITLINTIDVISMNDIPVRAVKRKRESAIVLGIRLLKEKAIDVFFSPGNTGAIVVAAVIYLGLIPGIKKPAMATSFPRLGGGETVILDIGANPDAHELNLYHNAILGSAYYSLRWEKEKPRVGLLNMGVELGKGSKVFKRAFAFMKDISSFNGNIEGYDIFDGSVDVAVCDGFTGNCVLKVAESVKRYFISVTKSLEKEEQEKTKRFLPLDKLLSIFRKHNKKNVFKQFLPQYFGAAPLLGVNGVVLIGHGACSQKDLENAVKFSFNLYKNNFLDEFITVVKKILKKD